MKNNCKLATRDASQGHSQKTKQNKNHVLWKTISYLGRSKFQESNFYICNTAQKVFYYLMIGTELIHLIQWKPVHF